MIQGLGDSSVVKERVSGQVALEEQTQGGGPTQLPNVKRTVSPLMRVTVCERRTRRRSPARPKKTNTLERSDNSQSVFTGERAVPRATADSRLAQQLWHGALSSISTSRTPGTPKRVYTHGTYARHVCTHQLAPEPSDNGAPQQIFVPIQDSQFWGASIPTSCARGSVPAHSAL